MGYSNVWKGYSNIGDGLPNCERWVTQMCGRFAQILVMDYSTVGDGLLKCVEGLLKYW